MKRIARELLKIAAMIVEYGKKGLNNSWQKPFPETTKCVHCGGEARIAFTSYEPQQDGDVLAELHNFNRDSEIDGLWLHDNSAFATYLCKECLEPTTLYNQG